MFMNLNKHLAKIEELADAYGKPDGSEIVLARFAGVPPEMAKPALAMMRASFILGALAASGLLVEDDYEIPNEWLRSNDIDPDML